MSLRGRGKSDVPSSGYAFENHVADVAAVLDYTRLARFCLMGYSLGVPCAIGHTLQHPSGLIGLVLAGYPARYPALPADYAGVLVANPTRAKPDVARYLQRDSREVTLWDDLPRIDVPTLVVRDAREGALLSAGGRSQIRPGIETRPDDGSHGLWT